MRYIAGIDEVGRGAFAGPLIAACVVTLPNKFEIPLEIKIKDSKLLTAKQRERSDQWIRANAVSVGIGSASVDYINKYGLTKATKYAFLKAFNNASKKLEAPVHFLFVDAFFIKNLKGMNNRQLAFAKGESKSHSVAAASIVAKVYRDKLMTILSEQSKFKKYLWEQNKGYGTQLHRDAIRKFGASKHHRIQWLAKIKY